LGNAKNAGFFAKLRMTGKKRWWLSLWGLFCVVQRVKLKILIGIFLFTELY
jgi:hypothetical protein